MPSHKKSKTTRLRVGDKVILVMGGREVVATVVEDRGLIGVSGRQIVRVEAPVDLTYVADYELPADQLRLAPRSAA